MLKTRELLQKSGLALLVSLSLLLTACVSGPPKKAAPQIQQLADRQALNNFIYSELDKPVLVYFSYQANDKNDVSVNYDYFFQRYNEDILFGKYVVSEPLDALSQHELSTLPAINYYESGIVIDQLAGLPVSKDDRINLKSDIELWLRETVLRGIHAERQFHYRFQGGHVLQVNPY